MATNTLISGTPGVQHTSASLYVGDLAPDVTEALLFEIFNAVGPVASIRVCRDAVTRRSLGYAYVNFHNVTDAERALDTMNFISIRGRPCRIMWSQRDPSLRKSGLGNVFVKNLDKTIDHKTLYDTFSMFGNILSCKVAMDDKGESRGYGFVHYALPDSAEKAIKKVDGMVIAEKKVTVAQFVPKEQRQVGPRRFTNIYVQRFPPTWDEEKLRVIFEQIGPVDSVYISTDQGRPFGFCNYPDPDNAAKAVEFFNKKEIEGSTLYVTRAMKKVEREKFLKEKYERIKADRQKQFAGVNLYVKFLDDSIDDERLRAEFAKFGEITSAKVMRDQNGRSRGFGFVCFKTQEESTRAMAEMNTKYLEKKPLYVALAQRKDQRRATLEKERPPQDPSTPWQERGNRKPMGGGRGRGRGVRGGQQMKQSMTYGPQNFNMYGGRGFTAQQMPYVQPQMRGGWNNMPRTPMMPGGFRSMQHTPYMQPPMNAIPPQIPPTGRTGGPGRGQQPPRQNMSNVSTSVQAPVQPRTQPRPAQRPSQGDVNQPLTSEMLNAANASQQKQMIGERIFPKIQHREPKLAGKITGMLLEMDNMELLHLLEDEAALMAKINEALAVLNSHTATEQEANPGME